MVGDVFFNEKKTVFYNKILEFVIFILPNNVIFVIYSCVYLPPPSCASDLVKKVSKKGPPTLLRVWKCY